MPILPCKAERRLVERPVRNHIRVLDVQKLVLERIWMVELRADVGEPALGACEVVGRAQSIAAAAKHLVESAVVLVSLTGCGGCHVDLPDVRDSVRRRAPDIGAGKWEPMSVPVVGYDGGAYFVISFNAFELGRLALSQSTN